MTDDLWTPATPPTPNGGSTKRGHGCRCRFARPQPGPYLWCLNCGGRVVDPELRRRGRSARRLGADQERRIERVYGPTKVGERGDAVDHLGRDWRWQAKATRADVPRWLAAIDAPTYRPRIAAALERAYAAMTGLYGDRASVLVRSYVRAGVRTRDWLVVAAHLGTERLGLPEAGRGWYVVPGDWWLDRVGRDEEVA